MLATNYAIVAIYEIYDYFPPTNVVTLPAIGSNAMKATTFPPQGFPCSK